jgi:hypothetical protein
VHQVQVSSFLKCGSEQTADERRNNVDGCGATTNLLFSTQVWPVLQFMCIYGVVNSDKPGWLRINLCGIALTVTLTVAIYCTTSKINKQRIFVQIDVGQIRNNNLKKRICSILNNKNSWALYLTRIIGCLLNMLDVNYISKIIVNLPLTFAIFVHKMFFRSA